MIWMNSRTVAHAIAIISTHDDGIPNNLDFFLPSTFLLYLNSATILELLHILKRDWKVMFGLIIDNNLTLVLCRIIKSLYINHRYINHLITSSKNWKFALEFLGHTWIHFLALLRLNFSFFCFYLSDLSNYRLMEM